MSYPTRRDYSWLVDKAGAPESPLPLQQDAKDFSLPREIDDRISPVFDALGWERYVDMRGAIFSAVNASGVSSTDVPAGRLRFIADISVSITNDALAVNAVLQHAVNGSIFVGLIPALIIPIGSAGQRFGAGRSVVLSPFDNLQWVLSASVGVGETVEMRYRFVDIPFGEYIPPR